MRLSEALRRHRWLGAARDAGLVLLLAGASFALGARPDNDLRSQFFTDVDVNAIWQTRLLWWWIAAVPAAVALFLRHRWPLLAVGLASASALAHLLIRDLWLLPMDLTAVIAVYTVASVAPNRRRGLVVLAGLLIALYVTVVAVRLGLGPLTLSEIIKGHPEPIRWLGAPLNALSVAAPPALVLGIGWAVGDNVRTRRLHLATLEQRAADLQRERDHRAALAVAAERARITRELHDVVAHGISVMVVQAQGGAAALRNHPERTATALANVIDTGRSALAEMRRLLGIARGEASGSALRAPQPGIGALPALIDLVRDTGTPVALLVEGEPYPLPAGVDLSAFRIVQEALTNTIKHARPGARAAVRLAFGPDEVEIEVTDTGPARVKGSTVEGNGLRGIQERVRLLGGSVRAGPGADGGFVVLARLPTEVTT